MHKNLKTPAVERLEKGNYHVYKKLFPAKLDPIARKLQESGNKQNKINRTLKLCTLANQ